MANTKESIIDGLVTSLSSISGIHTVTKDLLTPTKARANVPYIGVISGTEYVVAEDSTDILYRLQVDLIILVKSKEIEEWIDKVKQLIYTPIITTAKQIKIVGQNEVAVIDADKWSSTRMIINIIYVGNKTSF